MSCFFRPEVGPDEIIPCEGCPVAGLTDERAFSPTKVFTLGFEQSSLPKDEQEGVMLVRTSLLEKAEIEAKTLNTGMRAFRRLNGQDLPDSMLVAADEMGMAKVFMKPIEVGIAEARVPVEDWNEFMSAGCPGPTEGSRAWLVGRRRLSCGVVDFILKHDISRQ